MTHSTVGHHRPKNGDLWLKTHFYTRGNVMHAVTTIVVNAKAHTMRFSIPLAPIQAYIRKYGRKLLAEEAAVAGCVGSVGDEYFQVGGLWGSLKKISRKIGRNKILRKVRKVSRQVVRSNYTKAALAGVAIAFPPVAIPVLASYAAASVAMSTADDFSRDVKTTKKAYRNVKKLFKAKKKIRRTIRKVAVTGRGLKMTSRQRSIFNSLKGAKRRAYIKKIIAGRLRQSKAAKKVVRRGIRGSKRVSGNRGRRLKKRLSKGRKVRKKILGSIARLKRVEKSSDPAKALDAAKSLAILRVVARESKEIQLIGKGPRAGVFIGPYGNLQQGVYSATGRGRGLLYTPEGHGRGTFTRSS